MIRKKPERNEHLLQNDNTERPDSQFSKWKTQSEVDEEERQTKEAKKYKTSSLTTKSR
jgi:hypothetical protein